MLQEQSCRSRREVSWNGRGGGGGEREGERGGPLPPSSSSFSSTVPKRSQLFQSRQLSTTRPLRRHASTPLSSQSLLLDLTSAPSSHVAIMCLLPHKYHRRTTNATSTGTAVATVATTTTTSTSTNNSPPHLAGQRQCLCGSSRERKKSFRKAWHGGRDGGGYYYSPRDPQLHNKLPEVVPPACLLTEAQDAYQPERLKSASPHFKSCTLYLQVKVAEMLGGSKRKKVNEVEEPDVQRFSICWKLLEKLCKMKTPFARVLSTIQQELDKAINSSYVTPMGGTGNFEHVPYFELLSKLEARKKDILAEREVWKQDILDRKLCIHNAEQQMKDLEESIQVLELSSRVLKIKLSGVLDALETTVAKVANLQADLTKMKNKMAQAKTEQYHLFKIRYEQASRKERIAELKESFDTMMVGLEQSKASLEIVQCEVADSVPKEQMAAAKLEVENLENKLAQVEALAAAQQAIAPELTPRPPWDQLLGISEVASKSTAELATHISMENLQLTEKLSRIQEDCVQAEIQIIEMNKVTHEVVGNDAKIMQSKEEKKEREAKILGKKRETVIS